MTLTEITQAIRDLSDPEFRALQAEMWTINRERYTFQGDTYEVIQGHTSAAHWPPNAVPALYRKV